MANHIMENFTEYKTSKFQLQHVCYEVQLIHYEQSNEVDKERGNVLYCSLQNQCYDHLIRLATIIHDASKA